MRSTNEPTTNKVAVIGFPYDHNSSFALGAAEAPPLIREALHSKASNAWSESGVELNSEVLFDAGDIERSTHDSNSVISVEADSLSTENAEIFSRIERSISDLLDRGFSPVSLGGDHSITYPIVKAFARKFGELSIVHFDAHPDLYDEFEGNRYSHACPFARIMEENLVQRLIQVGVRTMTGHQREQTERFNVEVVEMKNWRDDVKFDLNSPVYISFDIDVLDPAFAPGVSHREPGGLSTRQAIDTIRKLKASVVGGDVVEFNPRMDPLNLTATVCAKLMKEIAAKILNSTP